MAKGEKTSTYRRHFPEGPYPYNVPPSTFNEVFEQSLNDRYMQDTNYARFYDNLEQNLLRYFAEKNKKKDKKKKK